MTKIQKMFTHCGVNIWFDTDEYNEGSDRTSLSLLDGIYIASVDGKIYCSGSFLDTMVFKVVGK